MGQAIFTDLLAGRGNVHVEEVGGRSNITVDHGIEDHAMLGLGITVRAIEAGHEMTIPVSEVEQELRKIN